MKLVFNPFTGNLDYVASTPGDVGIVFPLAPNLGGTGIANAAGSTLTLGGATSITGGGTVALGGFTLTVPATLTVAGLAIQNVFTTTQQITVPTATQKGLILKTSDNNTTNPLLEVQSSSGGQLTTIGPLGNLAMTMTATASVNKGIDVSVFAAGTISITGMNFLVTKSAGSTGGNALGINGNARVTTNAAAGSTVAILAGMTANITLAGTAAGARTATVTTQAAALLVSEPGLTAPIALPSNALEGININNQGNALVGTSYALRVRDQSGSTTANFAIHTGAGDVRFGGDTYWEGDSTGLPYGSCSSNDTDINWTQAAAVQNTWYDISDADMVDGQLNLVTHDGSGKLTVTKGGRYLINYGMVAEASAANTHLETAISVSGTESGQGISHAEAVTPNAERNFSGTAILDLAANATINLSIRTTDAGTPNLKVEMMDITLAMVGGT